MLSAAQLYARATAFAFLSVAALALAVSYIYCPSGSFCADAYYKYLVPLLIPVTAWFAIANWVGWTYFRFAAAQEVPRQPPWLRILLHK
ncbi:hypothetical protein CspeluHIS016_0204480 [Cutaneotrichosporon spelunceum]|uniref:Uncharacterized protein n=1 Tax=Cutaneotrichosporon spelunceum TaxID=1672016 RepID=A0AAD3TRZ6_9TREE|nr:hypothetical protein CspeluHIS016_0204480 [Cutaneotrichosporon spelunceum]